MTQQKSSNVTWHHGDINREEREKLAGHRGATVWLTGLSGSGKSTVAVELEKALYARGVHCYRLDGDNVRMGINKNLGFSAEDRTENIRRIGEVAKLFADAGNIALSSFISPYQQDRDLVRETHKQGDLSFIEVFVDCPLSEAEKRDPKGLYKKARAGEIKNFTGIDDPYEAPEKPEVHLHSDKQSLQEEVQVILDALVAQNIISAEKGTSE